MKISELMTKEAMVIRDSVPIQKMAKLFRKHEITGAPVIDDDGELVGVVSMTDLARRRTEQLAEAEGSDYYLNPSWGTVHLPETDPSEELVRDIMTCLIICAEEDDDIERAADLMVNHGIHRVVVTKNDKVTGVITSSDLVREFRDRLRKEANR